MTFNLVDRFILWLKKILHIRPGKVTPQPEEKTGEVSPAKGKPAEMPLLETKTTEGTLLREQRPPGIASEKEPQEQSGEEIPTTESQTKPTIEEDKTEEKDTLKPRRPYKKKPPTEETKGEPIKLLTTERKPSTPKQRKTIYLGDTPRRRRRLTGVQQKSQSDEDIDKETTDKTPEEKKLATTVESPFVEIDLDDANVHLILPQQQLKDNTEDKTPKELSYSLDLNRKQQEVPVKIRIGRDGSVFTEEKRISLEEPLLKFQVAFPDEIQGGEYNYNHNDKGLYAFVAIGNNRGRMYYLFDKDGKSNPLPKRVIWVLLHEEFMLQTILGPSDIADERWIWDKYKPFRIDLGEIDALLIKNRRSGGEKSFSLQSTFCVEGEQLIEDDFKKECPLFTGKTLKIIAPFENQDGWNVWIQNKVAGFRVKENWTGNEPLILNCPEDLPCDCGEFQVDICQQDTRISDEALFFRWMPSIELNYPKELIIPNPKLDRTFSVISVKLYGDDEWELKHKEGLEFKLTRRNNIYEIELPPEEDTLRFSIVKTTKPESICNFQITLPRLKWKTSKQKVWNSRLQNIERKDLKSGEPFYLRIQTNDFDDKYDLSAILRANGQKLQEGKFIRKGIEYSLELNQFFDTIKHNKNELILEVEIRKMKDLRLLGSVEILYFAGEQVPITIPPPKPRRIQALVECRGQASKLRKARGFSGRELKSAGINLKDVRRLNIFYDKRRKSSHPWNVESLKSLM